MSTALFTGATDGIGRERARRIGALGRRALVHGRNEAKAHHAATELARAGAGR